MNRSGRAALAAVTLLMATACGGEDLPPEIAAGRDLYAANCATCHGEGARGDGPLATSLPVPPPSILEHLGHHTGAQLLGLIRNGVPPAMPPAALTEQEVQMVIEYVWTLVPETEVTALRAMRDQMEAAAQGSTTAPPAAPDTSHEGHAMPPSGGASPR